MPRLGSLVTVMSPPNCRASWLEMASPRPRATEARRPRRGVNLIKGLENAVELVAAHADAGVGDVEADGLCAVALLGEGERERNGAGVGEFERVAHEIEKDLAETDAIGLERFGDIVKNAEDQREILRDGSGVQKIDGLAGDFPHIVIGD